MWSIEEQVSFRHNGVFLTESVNSGAGIILCSSSIFVTPICCNVQPRETGYEHVVLIKPTLPARRWTAKEFTDTHTHYGLFIDDFHAVQQTPLCRSLTGLCTQEVLTVPGAEILVAASLGLVPVLHQQQHLCGLNVSKWKEIKKIFTSLHQAWSLQEYCKYQVTTVCPISDELYSFV